MTTSHSLTAERLRLLHRSSDGNAGVELIALIAGALLLQRLDSPWLLCGWVGASVIWACLRHLLWQRTRQAIENDAELEPFVPWTIAAMIGGGLLWGIFGLAAMAPQLDGWRWLVVLVLGIVVTGGGLTFAALPWVQLAFIGPAVLPLALSLLLEPRLRLGGAAILAYAELMVLMACAGDRRATLLFGLQLEHAAQAARLGAAQRRAEEESRAKSRVLADMSHELRTPLNAIIGFADIIKSELFGPLGSARYADYAADIQACGLHLMGVASDVLELTKAEAGAQVVDITEVDLKAVVRQVDTILRPSATKAGMTLRMQTDDLPVMRTDQTKLRQILLNLVSNAIKFTPAGGTVTLTAQTSGDQVEIVVADTGIGIAPDDIPKALMPYGQVDASAGRRNQGTGLGLPLASRFATLLGGSLRIDSTVGQGTTVTVTLPLNTVAVQPAS